MYCRQHFKKASLAHSHQKLTYVRDIEALRSDAKWEELQEVNEPIPEQEERGAWIGSRE